jgi:uncharacterized surface protein with fasciclin (FAS1) repeats
MNVKKLATASVLGVAVFLTAACGSDTPAATPGSSDAATSQMTSGGEMSSGEMSSGEMTSGGEMSSGEMSSGEMTSGEMSSGEMSSGSGDPAANLVGAGCADYAKANPSGAGSVGGMAQAKVAEAATANPLLKTLVAAVSGKVNPDVNLVDTLDGGEFTVFAPVDTAFAKVDAATMGKLKTDKDLLTSILTYHVIAGQIAPDKIVGTHKTVQGGDVTVTGSGDNLKVGDATVICGGVKTANATVYLIDSVLSPPAS